MWRPADEFGLGEVTSYTVSIEFDKRVEPIPGDLDNDGDVDFFDVERLAFEKTVKGIGK